MNRRSVLSILGFAPVGVGVENFTLEAKAGDLPIAQHVTKESVADGLSRLAEMIRTEEIAVCQLKFEADVQHDSIIYQTMFLKFIALKSKDV